MKKIIICAILICVISGLYCENTSVVMVGNKVVFESDVRMKMKEENKDYEEALRDVVIEKMLLFQAENEGIVVSLDELTLEIERIKKRFPDEVSFYKALEADNIPYSIFVKTVEEKIKVRNIIKKNVVDKIEITTPEIAAKMKELKEKGNYYYRFRLKWFDSESSAQEFINAFDNTKETDMGEEGILSREEIMSEVLSEIEKLSPGKLSGPIKIGNRYLVVFLKDVRHEEVNSYQQLYLNARMTLQNMKFEEKFNNYLKELHSKIPVFYCD
ncbi:MAG: peptidyl-prolyl cis-trans isomerase [Candidatus Omnitrophica bacterium]|nr:peptidyl-prolyl cis-trans isomerase [Candidatus Omnitrophota bacterium]MCM8776848.1 peptidyl-prolyl cis-trans isomerase [Candidatus Omnitrophota bacterium]